MIFSIMAPAPIPGVRDQPFFFRWISVHTDTWYSYALIYAGTYILIYSMSLIYVLACMISILLKIKITCTHLLHNIPLHSGWNFYP